MFCLPAFSSSLCNGILAVVIWVYHLHSSNNYTPGIYADGYIVFGSSVCMFVRSLVRSLFRNVRGIYVKVFVKVSLVVYIS